MLPTFQEAPAPHPGLFTWRLSIMPKKRDIIYILGDGAQEELRYSLRSIEKNFPHDKVWFIGSQPKGFKPDVAVPHQQAGANKWERIRSSLLKAAADPRLTEDFFLFNDDFFIMQPFKGKFINYADKTLTWRIEQLREQYPWLNNYGRTLVKAREELKIHGFGEINFEVHLPFLMNKQAALKSILTCSSPQMRSVYGNVNSIPYIQKDDVKVYDMETVPEDADFISTNDETFTKGKVGEYIRQIFSEPCRYEVAGNE